MESLFKNVGEFGGVKDMNCGATNTKSNGTNMKLGGCDTVFIVPYIDYCNESDV